MNSILESVQRFYTNTNNYVKEGLEEEGNCIVANDNIISEIQDMIYSGNFEEVDNGHYLIPIMGNKTFHLLANGQCYIDDELGNENEVQIMPNDVKELLNMVHPTEYRMVSEKKNVFTGFDQDPQSKIIQWHTKKGVSPDKAKEEAHNALQRHIERQNNKEEGPSLKDRRNDPDYMDKVRQHKEKRGCDHDWRQLKLDLKEENDDSVYNLGNDEKGNTEFQASQGNGYINKLDEDKLRQIVKNAVAANMKKIL